MRKIVFTLSAAALALGGAAYAQNDKGAMPMGDMTRAQAQAKAEKMFDKMDANHDGILNQADREARMAQRFDKIDTNHDGSISREEFMAAHQRHHRMGHGAMQGKDADGGKSKAMRMGMRHGKHHGRMGAMMIMRMADPNHTGSVTRSAFVDAALKMFDKADANRDGTVTPAERKAAMQAMHAKWKAKAAQGHAEHDQHD